MILTIEDYEAALADKRRLTRGIDVAMHGEEGAAKQASLCDLIGPAKNMRAENIRLRAVINRAGALACQQAPYSMILDALAEFDKSP